MMALRLQRLRARAASGLRQVVWWIWPSYPTSWSGISARLRPPVSQIARLTVAGVVAYIVAEAVSPGILDLTAPLTALLVVQASTVGTARMGLVRVGAVLTGVLVAVVVSSWIGLTWWSLGAVIAASLVLARILRLGEQSLEAPISGMLILAVSTPELAAEVRVANTLIGTVVGIIFSLVVPVAIPNAKATEWVRRVARSQAALLHEVAMALADRDPQAEEAKAWSDWIDHIAGDIGAAYASVHAVEERRRFNPRALAAATVHPGLRAVLDRLHRSLAAERALLILISKSVPAHQAGRASTTELRRAFAVVLVNVANALRAFGDVVNAEFGTDIDQRDEALSRMVDSVQETRAVLTELMLIDVDPRQSSDLWMLQGSVLASVEQVLLQLEIDRDEKSREPWLTRQRLPLLPVVPLKSSPSSPADNQPIRQRQRAAPRRRREQGTNR